MAKDYVPHKDPDFSNFEKTFITEVTANKSTWHLPTTEAAAFTVLTGKQAIWQTKYGVVASGSFTHADVQGKDDAREAYVTGNKTDPDDCSIRIYYMRYMRNNPYVTNEQRVKMGLPVFDETKTPTPPAGEKSVNEELAGAILSNPHLKVTSSVLTPGQKSKAKGEDVAYIEVLIAFTAPDEKCPPEEVFKKAGEVSRGFCTLTFTSDQVGRRVWMIARKVFKGKVKTYGHFCAPWSTIVC